MRKETLLKILNSVTTSQSLTEIADRLYLSQPYISEILHNAETKYQVVLVKRKPAPIELTEAGQIFLNDLNKIIELNNKLKLDIYPYTNQSGITVKIAFHHPWTVTAGAEIMQRLQTQYPTVQFEIVELTSDLGKRKLLTRDIDILVSKEFHNTKFKTNFIMNEPLSLIVPASSKLFRTNLPRTELTLPELSKFNGEPFISLTDDYFYQRMIDHMFLTQGITVKTVIKYGNLIAAARAATAGGGCIITITNLVKSFINTSSCNVYDIPHSILKLDLGLAYINDAPELVKQIADQLTVLLQNTTI